MILRIVKLTFKPEHREDFLQYIVKFREEISLSPGCHGVEILNAILDKNVFFTYSKWEDDESLNQYRESPLFQMVWTQVKQWFSERPEAWSLEEI